MARLILDENGKQRAFRLNDGRLTIGSGESNSLTLSSPDVAEVHAELRVADGVVTLVPKPGVMPPTLLGNPVKQPTRLAANAEFKIGASLFRIVSDDQSAAPAKAKAPAVARKTKKPTEGGRSGGVERRRRTVKKGIPGYAIVGIVLVICVVGYMFGTSWLEDGLETKWDPGERFLQARVAYNSGSIKAAEEELSRIDLSLVTPELKVKVLELRNMIAADASRANLNEYNMKGIQWLDGNLKGYAKSYLSGDRAERHKARYFMKRCAEFEKLWPKHPDQDWVNRYKKRFGKIAKMDSPDEFTDLEWEVKRRVGGKPRDYILVFKIINKFLAENGGEAKTKAQAVYAEQIIGREEYHLDRMLQAKFHWERKEYGQAIEWLVQVIVLIGDESMEDQAIDFFLKMQTNTGEPLSDRYLATYQKNRKEQFAVLMTHPRLKAAAQTAGLL
ncbi:MAG: hypothetical protein ACI8X5_001535 [Planctomycetota bacterium]|jgi:hypothetical protein